MTEESYSSGIVTALHGASFAEPESGKHLSTEYDSGACATPRATSTDRIDPYPKRACAMPTLEQQLPLTFTLLSNRHTGADK